MVAAIQTRLYAALLVSFWVLGLCLTFAQPVFSAPDEPLHWMTANVRIERLLGSEGCVPTVHEYPCPKESVCSSIPALKLDCIQDTYLYGDAFTYPGVLIAKLLLPRQTESAVRQVQGFVLSRLLQGLIVFLCLVRVGVLAHRTGRLGSLTLAAFALSPLLAQQAFAVSSDGAQLGFGLCLFAAVLFWDALTRLDVFMFLLLGYASTAKPTVLPLLLPAVCAAHWLTQVARPEAARIRDLARDQLRLFKPTRAPSPQTLIAWVSLMLTVLTVAFSLLHDAQEQAVSTPADNEGRIAHLRELRDHPLLVFELPGRLHQDPSEARRWVGPLGWLDARVSRAVVNAFSRTLWVCFGLELAALAWFAARHRISFSAVGRRLLSSLPGLGLGLLGVFVNVLFVTAIMYVLWTPLGSVRVEGVQMRYFFPAAMLLIALGFRTLQALAALPAEQTVALPARARWLAVAAPCLVIAMSLSFVARLYVDLSVRYHDPARYQSR